MPSRHTSSPSQGCLQRKTLAANGPVFRWQSNGNGADEQPHVAHPLGEQALNRRAHGRALCIGLGDVLRQRPKRHTFLVSVALEDAPLEDRLVLLRSIGRVYPFARADVLCGDRIRQPRPVLNIGRAGIPSADQPVSPVDADVIVATNMGRPISTSLKPQSARLEAGLGSPCCQSSIGNPLGSLRLACSRPEAKFL